MKKYLGTLVRTLGKISLSIISLSVTGLMILFGLVISSRSVFIISCSVYFIICLLVTWELINVVEIASRWK